MGKITTAERKHQDYLRLKGLKVGQVYERKLIGLRRHELKRVLEICKEFEPSQWAEVMDFNINEAAYLPKWQEGLILNAGIPMAKSTARDLRQAKAADEVGIWESSLSSYAKRRAGENIVIVQGTFKDTLRKIITTIMETDIDMGIEVLARKVFSKYKELELWQARRIAQTETMISLAEAADVAAKTLDIGYTKQWCTSGLSNVRETHMSMDGVVVDQEEPFFIRESNAYLMFPHDESMGAPAGEIINCACACIRRPK